MVPVIVIEYLICIYMVIMFTYYKTLLHIGIEIFVCVLGERKRGKRDKYSNTMLD